MGLRGARVGELPRVVRELLRRPRGVGRDDVRGHAAELRGDGLRQHRLRRSGAGGTAPDDGVVRRDAARQVDGRDRLVVHELCADLRVADDRGENAELDQRLEAAEEVLVLVLTHRVVLDDDGAAADEELVDAVDERQKVLVARAEHDAHAAAVCRRRRLESLAALRRLGARREPHLR